MQPPVEAASQRIAAFDPPRILDEAGKLLRVLIFEKRLRSAQPNQTTGTIENR